MTVAPLPLDRLCIHQVTLMQCGFRQSIECLARHDVRWTALWREKLDEVGAAEAARILGGEGVRAVSLCAGGHLTGRGAAARSQALDANRRWIDETAAVGAASMVTLTGGLDDGDNDLAGARARAEEGLLALAPMARAAGVRIALEPLHPMVCGFRSVISTLREANDLLDRLGAPDVFGIAFDSYALWWEPDLEREIARAGDRIVNFHVSDWLRETRDVRLDRGMPGDGQIDNRRIRGAVEAAGFNGLVEVEIFSDADWWRRPPDETVATIVERAARCL